MHIPTEAKEYFVLGRDDVKVTTGPKKAPKDPALTKILKELKDDEVWKTPDDYEISWKDIKTSHPEISEQLKPLFSGKERISVADLKEEIKKFAPPDDSFWISLSKWEGGQRDLGLPQIVVQLNMSPKIMDEIKKNKIALDFFDTVSKKMTRSGHPTHNQNIAWARVYDLEDIFVVEEIQSDIFGASTTLRETANGSIDEVLESYTTEEKKNLEEFWHQHFLDWDKTLLATVIALARKKGKKAIWIFDEEYKKRHLQSASKAKRFYKVVPRDLGFKRANFEYDNKTIPAWTRVVAEFKNQVSAKYEVSL